MVVHIGDHHHKLRRMPGLPSWHKFQLDKSRSLYFPQESKYPLDTELVSRKLMGMSSQLGKFYMLSLMIQKTILLNKCS